MSKQRKTSAWTAKGLAPLRIAVNVSPIQLKHRNFIDDLATALRINSPGHAGIDIEITEGVIVDDLDDCIRKLSAVRELGVQVAIDDFGTGYSSLRYLAKLPIDALKIDRSFVSMVTETPNDLAIVSAIIVLAHGLNLDVVAEGVERGTQIADWALAGHYDLQAPSNKVAIGAHWFQSTIGGHCILGLATKIYAAFLLCLILGTPVCTAAAPQPYRIVGYVEGWSTPAVIHPEKLTHINFAFAHIGADGRVSLADTAMAANLKRLVGLKKTNPRLKVIISIGGWEADGFSDAALTEPSRAVFVDSALELVRKYALDGVDIDWEYPGQGVAGIKYRAEDQHNFTLLLKALRDKLGNRLLLTIASADREYFQHTEMDQLHVYLDWINVMSYDFFNSLTPTTGHHAGLYKSSTAAPTDRDADSSIKQHLAAGIPAEKIVLGVAFYGRGFTDVRAVSHGLNQPYGRFESAHDYAELANSLIGRQGFERYWDDEAKAAYLWNSASRTFISYDDPQSIRTKARYVKDHHLGGMMFWELSEDRNDELLDVIVRSLK